ncbi:sulfotransferase [Planktothrix serta]|uniref:sulfotransferase n=1 Tax=Planktothrix serta TaxID=1678310 RepID=UPI001E282848|nr:sulfotransferase [Planktothrix serta]
MNKKNIFSNFKTYGKYLWNRPLLPEKRFVIFGRGRSGSTLLVSLLNTHSQIYCDGEILHDWVSFPRLQINVCASRCQRPVYGFKLLSYQMRDIQPIINSTQFLTNLYQHGYQIIYLRRRNLLTHAFSNINARQQKFHHQSSQGTIQNHKIYVDYQTLINWIEHSEQLEQYEHKIIQNLPCLSLIYEDHLLTPESQQKTADQIFNWLDLPPESVTTNFVKLMPSDLSKRIVNYEELVTKLQQTRYARFLENPN